MIHLNLEIGFPVAIDVALDIDVCAVLGEVQLARFVVELGFADKLEVLIAALLGIGVDRVEIDLISSSVARGGSESRKRGPMPE